MPRFKTPVWMTVVIIIFMLPVLQTPELLATAPADPPVVATLLKIYPFYVLLTGYLAYICYPTRPWMSWILLVVSLLSDVAVWLLVTQPLQ